MLKIFVAIKVALERKKNGLVLERNGKTFMKKFLNFIGNREVSDVFA